MNELTLRVKQNPGTIELNFAELNQQMDEKLAEYKGIVFTEETKDIAKRELASLRKLKKDVDSARTAAKKEWMKPYEMFEKEMKKLSAKVDEPIGLIDGQVKEFEERRRNEKREEIRKAYEELAGDIEEYLPFVRIYDKRWENATVSMKSIRESIEALADNARIAVDTIRSMQSEAVEDALGIYKDSMDMAKAVAYINNYERQRAEIIRREEERRRLEEERRHQAEIERVKAEEREAAAREERIRKEAEEEAAKKQRLEQPTLPETEKDPGASSDLVSAFESAEDAEELLPFNTPETVTAFYKIVGTPEELERVEESLGDMGLYFERREP